MTRLVALVALAATAACASVVTSPDAGPTPDADGSGFTVTVTTSGDGSGTVTSSLAGIDCPGDCDQLYPPDTNVTLTATPTGGSSFAGWSGGGCTGTGDCVLSVTADVNVVATFELDESTLAVTIEGNGTGTVVSNPVGIDCPGDCDEAFLPDTFVTLTATPTGGSFEGWSGGGCSGTGTCEVTMVSAINVTATFTLPQFVLSVTKDGNGTGTVTSVPAGISCGGTCDATFDNNTEVTLTAVPDGDSAFDGWTGGGCSGTDPCVVTMTAATIVNATFICPTGSVTFNHTGAAQNFSVPECVSSITIDAYGAQGGMGNEPGGLGGRAQGVATVTGGETLVIMVGGTGITAPSTGDIAGFPGGFNGGGNVYEFVGWTGQSEGICGTGGGASDVRRGGSGLGNRIIVAAGGGGGASQGGNVGGAGGGLTGETAPSDGGNQQGGGGGTQSAGGTAYQCCGAPYPNEPGSLGQGGAAYRDASGSGAGGGGYYGGGGGSFDGGGGGSSYIAGLSGGSTTTGANGGNGAVTLSW